MDIDALRKLMDEMWDEIRVSKTKTEAKSRLKKHEIPKTAIYACVILMKTCSPGPKLDELTQMYLFFREWL